MDESIKQLRSLPRLYAITNQSQAQGRRCLLERLDAMFEAGLRLIQVRDKELSDAERFALAQSIEDLAPSDATVLINGRADISNAVGADGVHRPQSGLPISGIREILNDGIVGVSAHSVEEAQKAQRRGADFITISPVFRTNSKPGYGPPLGLERLKKVCRSVELPVYALAGVSPDSVQSCLDAGAYGVAVMSGLMVAEHPAEKLRAYLPSDSA